MAGRRSTSRAGTSVRTTTTPKPLARVHCTTARCGNCLTGALARADAQLRGQVEALNIGGAGAPDDELIYVGVVQELIVDELQGYSAYYTATLGREATGTLVRHVQSLDTWIGPSAIQAYANARGLGIACYLLKRSKTGECTRPMLSMGKERYLPARRDDAAGELDAASIQWIVIAREVDNGHFVSVKSAGVVVDKDGMSGAVNKAMRGGGEYGNGMLKSELAVPASSSGNVVTPTVFKTIGLSSGTRTSVTTPLPPTTVLTNGMTNEFAPTMTPSYAVTPPSAIFAQLRTAAMHMTGLLVDLAAHHYATTGQLPPSNLIPHPLQLTANHAPTTNMGYAGPTPQHVTVPVETNPPYSSAPVEMHLPRSQRLNQIWSEMSTAQPHGHSEGSGSSQTRKRNPSVSCTSNDGDADADEDEPKVESRRVRQSKHVNNSTTNSAPKLQFAMRGRSKKVKMEMSPVVGDQSPARTSTPETKSNSDDELHEEDEEITSEESSQVSPRKSTRVSKKPVLFEAAPPNFEARHRGASRNRKRRPRAKPETNDPCEASQCRTPPPSSAPHSVEKGDARNDAGVTVSNNVDTEGSSTTAMTTIDDTCGQKRVELLKDFFDNCSAASNEE